MTQKRPDALLSDHFTCPECGEPSVDPPAEVYCVECATRDWQRKKVLLYRCPTHGLVEATAEYRDRDWPNGEYGPVQHMCPINVNDEGSCFMPLDGPVAVELQ